MQTEKISITSQGAGMAEALAATEAFGKDCGLGHKENLRLRLLAEELVGLMRGIAGDVAAKYQVEETDGTFLLHLASNVTLTQELRRQLLAASSSGKNAAVRGFMGKIREMIAVMLLPDDPDVAMAKSGLSLGMMSMGSPVGSAYGVDSYMWSLNKYKENLTEGEEAWDELEKSIVANLADDVRVSIVGSDAEITIEKKF